MQFDHLKAYLSSSTQKYYIVTLISVRNAYPARHDAWAFGGPLSAMVGIVGPRTPSVSQPFPDHRAGNLDGQPLRSAADRLPSIVFMRF